MPESSKDSSQEDGPQSGGRRSLLTRVLIGAVVAPILTFVVLVVFFEHEAADDETPASVPGFRVSDGRILAPDGARFVVKGVTIPYGTFAGGDAKGLGTLNFLTVRSDLRRLRGLGVNTIKILVTPKPGDRDQLSRLRTVVRHARGQGFVVEIGAAFTGFESARDLMRELASTYRRDPYVWLQPMNEPNCPIGRPVPSCFDWLLWQRQQRALIKTIRAQGMTSPVVINTPGYSAALSRIDTYPLGDDGVVLGRSPLRQRQGHLRRPRPGGRAPRLGRSLDRPRGDRGHRRQPRRQGVRAALPLGGRIPRLRLGLGARRGGIGRDRLRVALVRRQHDDRSRPARSPRGAGST